MHTRDNNAHSREYHLLWITLAASLGGGLFGYDTAVISGAISNLREFFHLSSTEVGWATSSALVGCIFGALSTGFLTHALGRRPTMTISSLLFAASAIGTALPETFSLFICFRLLGGVGIGIASMVCPMYIAEIAPPHRRGRLVTLYQMAIVVGILTVFIVNFFIAQLGDLAWNNTLGWRYMFGSELLPALLFFFVLFRIPESPRWLISKGRVQEGKKILMKLHPETQSKQEYDEIVQSFNLAKQAQTKRFRPQTIRKILLTGICLASFQQLTGINVFMYYAPEIFKDFGSGIYTALFQTILIGAFNMGFTYLTLKTVDYHGRKPLLYYGLIGQIICLFMIGLGAYTQSVGSWLIVFVLGYISCFAFSLGPICWIVLSEIFPNSLRSKLMPIAVASQWLANFSVSQSFPMLMDNSYLEKTFHGAFPFWLYTFFALIVLGFIHYFIPETKGRTLEDIETSWDSSVVSHS